MSRLPNLPAPSCSARQGELSKPGRPHGGAAANSLPAAGDGTGRVSTTAGVTPRGGGIRRDDGSVLVLALMVTLIILAIGLTAMWLSSSGMKMSANITRRQEALYAAETGLSHARHILKNSLNWGLLAAGCPAGSPPQPNDPTGKGMVLCDNSNTTPLYNRSVLHGSITTRIKARWMANLRYTVFIRNDTAEVATGVSLNDDHDRRVVIRSEGVGRDGLSFFAIEAVLSQASAMLDEENYSQLGGSAQNMNSGNAQVPLPSGP